MEREIVLLKAGDRAIYTRKNALLLSELIPDFEEGPIIVDRLVNLFSDDPRDKGRLIALLGILNGPPEKIFVRLYGVDNPTMAMAKEMVAMFDKERVKEN